MSIGVKEETLDDIIAANERLEQAAAQAVREDTEHPFFDQGAGFYSALPVTTVPDVDIAGDGPTAEDQERIDAFLASEGEARFRAELQSAGAVTVSQEERDDLLLARSSSPDKVDL